SRVMSYAFAEPGADCPFFARRLATVFRQQKQKGEPIYRAVRESGEAEVLARGLGRGKVWRGGRWHKEVCQGLLASSDISAEQLIKRDQGETKTTTTQRAKTTS